MCLIIKTRHVYESFWILFATLLYISPHRPSLQLHNTKAVTQIEKTHIPLKSSIKVSCFWLFKFHLIFFFWQESIKDGRWRHSNMHWYYLGYHFASSRCLSQIWLQGNVTSSSLLGVFLKFYFIKNILKIYKNSLKKFVCL